MKFDTPLIPAILIRRYKRFLADVTLEDGREVTAHVANPGSMLGMNMQGLRVWVEPNDDPKRKLDYSWKLAELECGAIVGVDTNLPNKIVKEALHNGLAEKLGYTKICAEVKYGVNSRIDFLLSNDKYPDCYIEVKSVTLSRSDRLAEFPDCVTKRGTKHMGELASMVLQGYRSVLLLLIQRNDVDRFAIAGDIDPEYEKAFIAAQKVGVEVLCYDTKLSSKGICLGKEIIILS